jgi:hypothetical protein
MVKSPLASSGQALPYTNDRDTSHFYWRTLSCENFFLAPAVSALLGQKAFAGQNGSKGSCGASGALTAA